MTRLKRILTIVLCAVALAASASFAGTECLAKGRYLLGIGTSSDIFGSYYLSAGDEHVVSIAVEPEFGYFFTDRSAVIGALGLTGYWVGDDDYQHIQLSGGIEHDIPLNNRVALFLRFVAGGDYDSESDDVYPLFGPSFGGKVFLAPQTPIWFGYGYQGVVETYESGDTELLSRHGINFGLQIIL